MVDWSSLPYFLAIARKRTLSAAARSLGVNQSTVSRRLAGLENQSGAKLFFHRPDGYELTEHGRGVLADVEALEAGVFAIERRLSSAGARIEGCVRVGLPESFAIGFLARHLPGLRSRHPGLVVELVIDDREHDLARREVDLAIRIMPRPHQRNLVIQAAGETTMAVYASQAYLAQRGRPTTGDFTGHDIVAYGGALSRLAPRWHEQASSGVTTVVARSLLTAHAAVAADLGVGLLATYLGQADPRLVRIATTPEGARKVWLVVHHELRRNRSIRAMLDYLRELFQRERAALGVA